MKNEIGSISDEFFTKIIFILILLFSIHFWTLRFIPQKFNPENIIVWLVCGYSIFMVSQKSILRFKYAIFLFLFGIITNVLASYINLGQNPKVSLLSFWSYYSILIYFLLHYFKLNRKFVENTVIVFSIIYSITFIISYKIYPNSIVTAGLGEDAGIRQLEIIGEGFLMLAYLLLLNRFIINRKLINIIFALAFMMVQLKCDFRTLIAGAILITVLMIIVTLRKASDFIIMISIAILVAGLMSYHGVSSILDKMMLETQKNINEGDKYVRNIQLEYYYKVYPKNISYYIIGGGRPAGGNLWQGEETWEMNYNIVWSDIGLLGFYVIVGGIATLGLLWYTLKAIFIRLPRDKLYLNFYFLYLIIVSFTNEEIYDDGVFTVQAIGLYLIDVALTEKSIYVDKTELQDKNFL
jgi:hypothetical protein